RHDEHDEETPSTTVLLLICGDSEIAGGARATPEPMTIPQCGFHPSKPAASVIVPSFPAAIDSLIQHTGRDLSSSSFPSVMSLVASTLATKRAASKSQQLSNLARTNKSFASDTA